MAASLLGVVIVGALLLLIVTTLLRRRRTSGSGRSQIIGDVRKIQWRQEHRKKMVSPPGSPPETVEVCTFRVEGADKDGNPRHLVTIEIRSESGFAGDLSEGDQITLYAGTRSPSGSINTSAVRNLTTGGIFGDKKKVNRGSVDVPPAHDANQTTQNLGN